MTHKKKHHGVHHMGVQNAENPAHFDEKDAFHAWEHGYFHEGAPRHVGHDKKGHKGKHHHKGHK